ncbi:FAD dependent oxidoreductase [Paraphaeosphaeria sporulosa]|uniref:FAD dependent oxidoreductase n=1 Tax=Paraphaeosphaeria sporulosa TaxID=1460663 RepID=A0A177CQI7_9PLEO|nr:FAD dependent oxidoreductase [Paraphaeosphaeria sporulosa]OAG09784.1 FAD dependent oxidoreductase [Paraphaeosphaeria sporulosa]
MEKSSKIVIVGAGVFGLSTARQLALEGFENITVLDRQMVPVPDGSSSDISRMVRFDYGDEDYLQLAYEAYKRWQEPKYKGIFSSASFILVGSNATNHGRSWLDKTTAALTKHKLPWSKIQDAAAARRSYPALSGELASPGFFGYSNEQAGWADASKAVIQLRDECIELGVSFICGRAGTVVGFETGSQQIVKGVKNLSGSCIPGDHFILTAGAWGSGLVEMYNSTLATAQTIAYLRLSEHELEKYKNLPMYANFCTGWFNFPPHAETRMLKFAIHGWGYTRAPETQDHAPIKDNISSPPLASRARPNFVPADGEQRLRRGLREILPELADRPFEKTALCWYTDTPSGDFIIDYHPDYANLFVGGAGSGHAFKFLPILGECMVKGLNKQLPEHLAAKWRFRTEYKDDKDVFLGDGSRGGPARRELDPQEKARL